MFTQHNRHLNMTRIVALVIGIVVVASACASTRPSVQEWQPTWDRAVAGIPPETVAGENPPREICDKTLVSLREISPELSPTPALAVDDAVMDWIDIAEDAFFECPPAGQQVGSFAQAYELLRRL
jgi:hypothetical protein